MHARISRYEAADWSLDELHRVGRQLAAAVGAVPGFVSYALLDVGNGELTSVCVFETLGQLERGEQVRRAWCETETRWPLGAPVAVITGEVVVQRGM
jgi:hypothetical protein